MQLPPDLNDLIAANHQVRIVNEVLDKMDISELLRQWQYKPRGHQQLLLFTTYKERSAASK